MSPLTVNIDIEAGGETITGLDDRELERMLAYWQKVLRLQDWVIRITRSRDLSSYARLHTDTALGKTATITIRQRIILENDSRVPMCMDEEVGLVHELMHLHTQGFEYLCEDHIKDESEFVHNAKIRAHNHLECMIELTAQALVSVRRNALVEVI